MTQLQAVVDFIRHPVKTLVSVPSNKFWLASFFIWVVSGCARWARIYPDFGIIYGNHFSAPTTIYLLSIISTATLLPVLFIVGALLTQGLVRLCGKRLSFKKVLNTIGYASLPRLGEPLLALALTGSIHYKSPPFSLRLTTEAAMIDILILLPSMYAGVVLIWALTKMQEES